MRSRPYSLLFVKRSIPTYGHSSRLSTGGFTIIELMIATLIFSLLLLLLTFGIIRFNAVYYGGLVQSDTQSVARSVLDNVSQAIQFSGGAVTTSIQANPDGTTGFCINSQRYSYLLGYQLVSGTVDSTKYQTNHGLVEDSPGVCSGLSAQALKTGPVASDSTELLSPKMRLSVMSVKPVAGTTDLWKVDVRVVYGDDDVLCAPSEDPGSCTAAAAMSTPPASPSLYQAPDLQCKGSTGTPFCAVSELSTVVQQRLSN